MAKMGKRACQDKHILPHKLANHGLWRIVLTVFYIAFHAQIASHENTL